MRKFFIACVAAVVAAGGFAVFATADDGPNGTSWSFALKPSKVLKPTSTDSVIEPAKVDDKGNSDASDDTYTAPNKTTIIFPAGSKFDTTVPPLCKASAGELARDRGASCTKALVGSGTANSVFAAPNEPKTGNANATIKAYNKKGGIYFLIQPCTGGTSPCTPLGNPFVLEGTLKATTAPQLIVPTPKALLDLNIVITKFSLKTKNLTKKRDGKIAAYTTTPAKCKGKWNSSAKINYQDGTTGTVKDSQPCSK